MVSDKVKALLALAGLKQSDIAEIYGMSKQSMNNKMSMNRFTADDLIRIAEIAGGRVAFVLGDGQHIYFDPNDARHK